MAHPLVLALFTTRDRAARAARALHGAGVAREQLSVVSRDHEEEGVLTEVYQGTVKFDPPTDIGDIHACSYIIREYLKTRYADLAELNREWGTAHADWSAVMPLTYEKVRKTGNHAPWIEHRLAQQLVWARLYRRTGEAMAENDPGALVGFDGPQSLSNPNGGINWWVPKDHVGILQDYLYNSESMEIFRSFAGPQHLSGVVGLGRA